MRRIGISRWLNLLGASPVAIALGLSLFLLSPSVSAQTAEERAKQYGREAMEKALETKRLYDLYGIHFDVDKATIRPETQPLFDDIAQVLKNFPMWRLRIVGHTDATGDAAHNQLLALQRANAVKSALVDRGIQDSRLETEGAGQNQPVASNDTPEGRALNRRVALIRLAETTINASAPIKGEGRFYKSGDNQLVFTGSFQGTVEVEGQRGDLQGAGMVCPGLMEVDRTDRTQRGEGRCIIATKGGEFLYARWACTGKPGEGCGGLFTIAGGTGKFSKASGLSLFWMRSTVAEVVTMVPEKDVTATFTGHVLWEVLKYTTP